MQYVNDLQEFLVIFAPIAALAAGVALAALIVLILLVTIQDVVNL